MATVETLLLCVVLCGANPSEMRPQLNAGAAPPRVEARQPDKVLLQFTSENCAPCKSMAPITRQLSVAGIPIKTLDIARNPGAVQAFQVKGAPTYIVLSGQTELARHQGTATADELRMLYLGEAPAAPQTLEAEQPQPDPTSKAYPVAVPTAGRQDSSDAVAIAMAATVRLKVEDPKGFSFGTGTIVDASGEEALVLTCGHIFRSSEGKGKITADLFSNGTPETVDGELITYDLTRDVALISIRPRGPVKAAQIAPGGYLVSPQQRVFSIGCDKGKEPKLIESQVTSVDKYQKVPNLCVAGLPVDGRSGGGLFSMTDGFLIGVCNAAIPTDNEGLYAGLGSVHGELDKIGYPQIYERGAEGNTTLSTDIASSPAVVPTIEPMPNDPEFPTNEPTRLPPQLGKQLPGTESLEQNPIGLAAGSAADMEDTEVICIVRSRKNPNAQSQIFVLDNVTPEMLEQLSVVGRPATADRMAMGTRGTDNTAPRGQTERPPILRGQNPR